MTPEKDIQSFAIPGSGTRLSALLSGKIDGAILPPPFNIEAEAQGFRRLMAGAEVYEGAISGLSTTSEKLRENAGQVKRVLRALLKSQSFIKENKTETVKIISDWLKLTPAVASASYDIYAQVLSSDGLVSEQALKIEIDRAVKAFKIGHEVPATNLIDFTILDTLRSEMKIPAGAQ
jgi:ABC-type nitrate/sulfonate/bicarbonate transport system substrate-binding protein